MTVPTEVRVGVFREEDDEALLAMAAEQQLELDPGAELERPYGILWVARRAVGAAPEGYLLAWEVADEIELLQLVVASTARRRGLGGALVDHLLAHGRSKRARAVHLEVRASNGPALALYRGRGFREEGRRLGYYAGGEDAILLSAWLG